MSQDERSQGRKLVKEWRDGHGLSYKLYDDGWLTAQIGFTDDANPIGFVMEEFGRVALELHTLKEQLNTPANLRLSGFDVDDVREGFHLRDGVTDEMIDEALRAYDERIYSEMVEAGFNVVEGVLRHWGYLDEEPATEVEDGTEGDD